jgi:hypothetical protein
MLKSSHRTVERGFASGHPEAVLILDYLSQVYSMIAAVTPHPVYRPLIAPDFASPKSRARRAANGLMMLNSQVH